MFREACPVSTHDSSRARTHILVLQGAHTVRSPVHPATPPAPRPPPSHHDRSPPEGDDDPQAGMHQCGGSVLEDLGAMSSSARCPLRSNTIPHLRAHCPTRRCTSLGVCRGVYGAKRVARLLVGSPGSFGECLPASHEVQQLRWLHPTTQTVEHMQQLMAMTLKGRDVKLWGGNKASLSPVCALPVQSWLSVRWTGSTCVRRCDVGAPHGRHTTLTACARAHSGCVVATGTAGWPHKPVKMSPV